MAEINLQPTFQAHEDIASANIRPVAGTVLQPNSDTPFTDAAQQLAATAEANTRKIDAEQKARKLKNDAAFNTLSTPDQMAILSYQQDYGAIPRNVMGGIDLPKIQQQREEDARLRRANAISAAALTGRVTNKIAKINPKTGQLEEVIQFIDPASQQITGEIFTGGIADAGGRGSLTALQRQQLEDQLIGKKNILHQIDKITAIVNNQNVNSVGPVAGGAEGRLWAWVSSKFGANEKINAQRAITQFLNQQAIDLVQYMKGQLSDRDVKFLQAAIPKLSDDEAVWNDWLNNMKQVYEARAQGTLSTLNKNGTVDILAPTGWTSTEDENSSGISDVTPAATQPGFTYTPPASGTNSPQISQ